MLVSAKLPGDAGQCCSTILARLDETRTEIVWVCYWCGTLYKIARKLPTPEYLYQRSNAYKGGLER